MRVRTAVGVAVLVVLVMVGSAVAWTLVRPPTPGGMGAALGAPRFTEEAQVAGLTHSYDGDFDYFVGGGVAAFDCNSDLRPDLYLAGGSNPAEMFINRSAAGAALGFERAASPVTDLTSVTGAYPIDVDGDGEIDLAVLRHGENVLLRGLGECHFERANEAWGFDGGDEWSTAFSARWDPGAEWPTIAIGNYLAPDRPGNALECSDNELHRPAATGTGFDAPTALSPSWCTLSILFTNWDRSGRRDLRVSNDRHYYRSDSDGAEQMWHIAPREEPREYTAADGWQRVRVWGMGIGDYDVTNDGYPDYYLTSQADNKLQVLAEGPASPHYEDIALARGVNVHRPHTGDTTLPSTAWHADFQDVNNDGYIDLFVSKGNVEAMPEYAALDPNNLLIGQPDGSFVEGAVAAGIVDFARSRGASLVDLNADGLLDLVVVTRRENVRLYRNLGSGTTAASAEMGNWVELELFQRGANRDAIGAWLEVRVDEHVMQRERTIGGGHVSDVLAPLHFGLGAADHAEVRVTWPDGSRGEWQSVAANHVYEISMGSSPRVVDSE